MQSPLDGIRILDLSRALAGPWCAALLSDLGAEIVKVENAPDGDPARAWGPFDSGRSLYFDSVNRGKSSLEIDFRAPGAIDLIRELISQVDVVIENFRPGVMAEMGLDPEHLRNRFPELIIASVSGFGSVGPERSSAGLDQVAQGMSGLVSVTGLDREHTYRVGVPIVDELAGIFTALGIASALYARRGGAGGAHVETSLLEAGIAAMTFHAQQYLSLGEIPEPHGNQHAVIAPYGAFATADIPITIAVGSARHWEAFCALLGDDELRDRPDYATGALRKLNSAALSREIEQLLSKGTAAQWLERLRGAGIPAGPIYTMDQVFADPQVQALGLSSNLVDDRGREVPVLQGPLTIDGERTRARRPAPSLGADGHRVLLDFGFSQERIDALLKDGILAAPSLFEEPS